MTPEARIAAAHRSLDGLSVGDAFGECFFSIEQSSLSHQMHLATRTLPNHRWRWTDDTAMAVSIVEVLSRHGEIQQDALAAAFAARYAWDDRRGYGGTAHGILMAIGGGQPWAKVSPAVFDGMGSMGNGGAMRSAPLGVYFADDIQRLVHQAKLSAEVTHANVEGQAGAVAVALAAAFVANYFSGTDSDAGTAMLDFVIAHTPDSLTRALTIQARELPQTYAIETAASVLGNSTKLTAQDTVPFCLWSAARALGDFEEAMWTTVSAGGDMDTNCAIVGGIIAADPRGAPAEEWLSRREPLPMPLG